MKSGSTKGQLDAELRLAFVWRALPGDRARRSEIQVNL